MPVGDHHLVRADNCLSILRYCSSLIGFWASSLFWYTTHSFMLALEFHHLNVWIVWIYIYIARVGPYLRVTRNLKNMYI